MARPYWIWPARLAGPLQAWLLASARRVHAQLGALGAWVVAGLVLGAAPLALEAWTGWFPHRPATVLGLTLLLIATVAVDRAAQGVSLLASAFLAHNVLAVQLARTDPAVAAAIFPHGPAYWRETLDWLRTGVNPEYALSYWVPHHALHAAGVAFFAYASLGAILLWEGLLEVDRMNYYVGQLLAHSHDPWIAASLGWHPWSVLRGFGFLFITFEVVSVSFQRLVGVEISPLPRRLRRWSIGLGLLVADALVKYCFMDDVRTVLAANLADSAWRLP